VNVEHPSTLFAKGALMRGIIADKKSPIVYGYTGDQMPIYFSQDPVSLIAGWTQLTCQKHLIDCKANKVILDLTCDFAAETEEIYFSGGRGNATADPLRG
jgi:hypothetical protein